PASAQQSTRDGTKKAAEVRAVSSTDAATASASNTTAPSSPDPFCNTDRYRLVMPVRFLP
ncbi:MAG: hypothetical protein RL398_3212, partial [Planctomycetota bacterium]